MPPRVLLSSSGSDDDAPARDCRLLHTQGQGAKGCDDLRGRRARLRASWPNDQRGSRASWFHGRRCKPAGFSNKDKDEDQNTAADSDRSATTSRRTAPASWARSNHHLLRTRHYHDERLRCHAHGRRFRRVRRRRECAQDSSSTRSSSKTCMRIQISGRRRRGCCTITPGHDEGAASGARPLPVSRATPANIGRAHVADQQQRARVRVREHARRERDMLREHHHRKLIVAPAGRAAPGRPHRHGQNLERDICGAQKMVSRRQVALTPSCWRDESPTQHLVQMRNPVERQGRSRPGSGPAPEPQVSTPPRSSPQCCSNRPRIWKTSSQTSSSPSGRRRAAAPRIENDASPDGLRGAAPVSRRSRSTRRTARASTAFSLCRPVTRPANAVRHCSSIPQRGPTSAVPRTPSISSGAVWPREATWS